MDQINELCQQMGVSHSELLAFVDCLRVWTDKGYSIEEAIKRHMGQMTRLAENSHKLPASIVVETFYPE